MHFVYCIDLFVQLEILFLYVRFGAPLWQSMHWINLETLLLLSLEPFISCMHIDRNVAPVLTFLYDAQKLTLIIAPSGFSVCSLSNIDFIQKILFIAIFYYYSTMSFMKMVFWATYFLMLCRNYKQACSHHAVSLFLFQGTFLGYVVPFLLEQKD